MTPSNECTAALEFDGLRTGSAGAMGRIRHQGLLHRIGDSVEGSIQVVRAAAQFFSRPSVNSNKLIEHFFPVSKLFALDGESAAVMANRFPCRASFKANSGCYLTAA